MVLKLGREECLIKVVCVTSFLPSFLLLLPSLSICSPLPLPLFPSLSLPLFPPLSHSLPLSLLLSSSISTYLFSPSLHLSRVLSLSPPLSPPLSPGFLTLHGSNLPFLSIYDLLAYFCFNKRYIQLTTQTACNVNLLCTASDTCVYTLR